MKLAIYNIPKGTVDLYAEAGLDLSKRAIKTRESENDGEVLQLVENADPENRRKLAQAQWDIIIQRRIRDYLESDEGIKLAKERGVDAVLAEAQKLADAYVYGSRVQTTGQATATRAKSGFADEVLAVAASDPAKIERLRKILGDKAVDALLAAQSAQADADKVAAEKAATKAAGGNGTTATAPSEPAAA